MLSPAFFWVFLYLSIASPLARLLQCGTATATKMIIYNLSGQQKKETRSRRIPIMTNNNRNLCVHEKIYERDASASGAVFSCVSIRAHRIDRTLQIRIFSSHLRYNVDVFIIFFFRALLSLLWNIWDFEQMRLCLTTVGTDPTQSKKKTTTT